MMDLLEGRYYKVMPQATHSGDIPERAPTRAISSVMEGDDECDADSMHSCSNSEAGDPPTDSCDPSLTSVQSGIGPAFQHGPCSWREKLILFLNVFHDTSCVGYPTLAIYGVLPVLLAAWSLIRRGTDFEYIVAVKPE